MNFFRWHRQSLLIGAAFLLLSNISPVLAQIPEYVGPQPCPSDASVLGYTNSTEMHFDMVAEAHAAYTSSDPPDDEFFEYVICPNTVMDLGTIEEGGSQVDFPIIPLISNTFISCGSSGEYEDNCQISGGFHQVHFMENLVTLDVFFVGIQFVKYQSVGVLAYGDPRSGAMFIDCLFKDGDAFAGVDIFFYPGIGKSNSDGRKLHSKDFGVGMIPQFSRLDHLLWMKSETLGGNVRNIANRPRGKRITEVLKKFDFERSPIERDLAPRKLQDEGTTMVYPAMFVGFHNTDFMDNEWIHYGIRNIFGLLQIEESNFAYNEAGTATVANVAFAKIALYPNALFEHNTDYFGPVFVDSYSSLVLNLAATGDENVGHLICGGNGVILEEEESFCLSDEAADGYVCEGSCCSFGDQNCDTWIPPTSNPSAETQGSLKENDKDDQSVSEAPTTGEQSLESSAASKISSSGEYSNRKMLLGVLIPVCVVFAFIVILMVYRRRRGREPVTADSAIELEIRGSGSAV